MKKWIPLLLGLSLIANGWLLYQVKHNQELVMQGSFQQASALVERSMNLIDLDLKNPKWNDPVFRKDLMDLMNGLVIANSTFMLQHVPVPSDIPNKMNQFNGFLIDHYLIDNDFWKGNLSKENSDTMKELQNRIEKSGFGSGPNVSKNWNDLSHKIDTFLSIPLPK